MELDVSNILIQIENIDRNLSQAQRNRLGLAAGDPENAAVVFHVIEEDSTGVRCIESVTMPFVRLTEGTRAEKKASKRALRAAIKARAQVAVENDEGDDDGLTGLEGKTLRL
jgi:hypothetical protein